MFPFLWETSLYFLNFSSNRPLFSPSLSSRLSMTGEGISPLPFLPSVYHSLLYIVKMARQREDGAAVSRRRRGSSAEIVRSFSFCVYF